MNNVKASAFMQRIKSQKRKPVKKAPPVIGTPAEQHAANLKRTQELSAANKEREEAEKKLQQMQRRLDHFERAKRLQEIPLFQEMYENQKAEDETFWVSTLFLYTHYGTLNVASTLAANHFLGISANRVLMC